MSAALQIGPLSIHIYGLMIGLGLLTGERVVSAVAARETKNGEVVANGFWWVAVSGLIGARLYHVIDWWNYYVTKPASVFAVWEGGLGILGGLIGGIVGLWLFSKLHRQRFSELLDLGAFGVTFGQAVGRLGNYFNQELYGKPTGLPWGIFIDPENRLAPYQTEARFHPLFFYEAVLSLILGTMMLWLWKRRVLEVGRGAFFGVYLIGYGTIRFFLEGFRIEPWTVGGVPTAQLVAGGLIVVGLACLLLGKGKRDGAEN